MSINEMNVDELTAERIWFDDLDCCVYKRDGEFVYGSRAGYRVFKTRKGFENFIAKQKKMHGIA